MELVNFILWSLNISNSSATFLDCYGLFPFFLTLFRLGVLYEDRFILNK